MLYRVLPGYLAALALALFIGATATAEEAADHADTHQGKIVSVTATNLVMTGKDGKEHSHTLTADTKLRCDGNACATEDLKRGQRITVTTQKDDPTVVTKIEAFANDNADLKDRRQSKDQADVHAYSKDRRESKSQSRESRYQPQSETPDQATVVVNLPEGARLTFDDSATVSTGAHRSFITPRLERGVVFHYAIRAELIRGGMTDIVSKRISVRAGSETRVDLVFGDAGPAAAVGDAGKGHAHSGRVVRIAPNELTMGDKEGSNEHTHAITSDTKITLDGKICRLADLEPGMRIRVTTKEGDKDVTTRVEARAIVSNPIP